MAETSSGEQKKNDDFLRQQEVLEDRINSELERDLLNRRSQIAEGLKHVNAEDFRDAIDFAGIKESLTDIAHSQSSSGGGVDPSELENTLQDLSRQDLPDALSEVSGRVLQGILDKIPNGAIPEDVLPEILDDVTAAEEQWNKKIDDFKTALEEAPQQFEDSVRDAATALKEKNIAEMQERQAAAAFSEDNFTSKLNEIIDNGPGEGGQALPEPMIEMMMKTYAKTAVENPNIAEKQLDAMVQRFPQHADQIAQVILDSYKAGEVDLSSVEQVDSKPVQKAPEPDKVDHSSNVELEPVEAEIKMETGHADAQKFQNSEDSFAQELSNIVIENSGENAQPAPENLVNRYALIAKLNPEAAAAQLDMMESSFPQYAGEIAQAMLDSHVEKAGLNPPQGDEVNGQSIDDWEMQGGNIEGNDKAAEPLNPTDPLISPGMKSL